MNYKSPKFQLTVIFSAYIGFAFIFGLANKYQINPDGVAYLRLAGYLAEGNFQQSISGYWGPLISWCMAPFLFFNVDGLITARIVIALWGMVFVSGVWLLQSRFSLSSGKRFIVMFIVSLLVAQWSSSVITPDILAAAVLTFYFYVVTDQDILKRKRLSFLSGFLGAFAYLAKSYAFPFFLVHYPLSLFIKGYVSKNDSGKIPFKNIVSQLFIGMFSFLLAASFWVCLISFKYHELTFSSVGEAAHAVVGPPDIERYHPSWIGLHKPEGLAIHTWEDPSKMEYKTWSPLDSKEYFLHQIKLCIKNAYSIFTIFYSFCGILGITLVFFIPLVLLLSRPPPQKVFLYFWILMTLAIYCAGYVFAFSDSARYYWPIFIIVLLMAFHFLNEWSVGWKSYVPNLIFLIYFINAVFIFQFISKPAIYFLRAAKENIFNTEKVNFYENIANQLGEHIGPFASIGNRYLPLYAAYYMNQKWFGGVTPSSANDITKELDRAGVKFFVVFGSSKNEQRLLVRDLKRDNRYSHEAYFGKGTISGYDHSIDVFELTER